MQYFGGVWQPYEKVAFSIMNRITLGTVCFVNQSSNVQLSFKLLQVFSKETFFLNAFIFETSFDTGYIMELGFYLRCNELKSFK